MHKQVHNISDKIVNRTEQTNFSNLSKDIGERIDRFKRTCDIAKESTQNTRKQLTLAMRSREIQQELTKCSKMAPVNQRDRCFPSQRDFLIDGHPRKE